MSQTAKIFARAGKHTISRLSKEYALLGYSDLADYIDVGDDGSMQIKAFATLPKGLTRAIKKIREKTVITESKDGELISKISTVEFELHGKQPALDMIVELMGMKPNQKVDHQGNVTFEVVTNVPRVPNED